MSIAKRYLIKIGMPAIAMLFIAMSVSPSLASCCRYGCCDCSCIAMRKSPLIAGKGARSVSNVHSVWIDLSDRPTTGKKWSCTPWFEGAYCTRK